MVCSLRDPPASLRGQFQVGPPARVSEESGGEKPAAALSVSLGRRSPI